MPRLTKYSKSLNIDMLNNIVEFIIILSKSFLKISVYFFTKLDLLSIGMF